MSKLIKVILYTLGFSVLLFGLWWYLKKPGGPLNPHDWMSEHFTPDTSTKFYPFVISMKDTRDKKHPVTVEVNLDICIKHGEFRPMK